MPISFDSTATVLDLRIFDQSNGRETDPIVAEQLPFLSDLKHRFEAVTGWSLEFLESYPAPGQRRRLDGRSPVSGQLKISDMSATLVAGQRIQHRGRCDDLAETLNEMLGMIQSQRQQEQKSERRLNVVVDAPFEMWKLAGQTGFNRQQLAAWSVTSDEKIRVFTARLASGSQPESALIAALMTGAFEIGCQLPISLQQCVPLLSESAQAFAPLECRFDWLAAIDLDPITGEFTIEGINVPEAVALYDVQAAVSLEITENEKEGILFTGQILEIGVSREHRRRIADLIPASEMTIGACRRILEREMNDSAALFLHRNQERHHIAKAF